MLLYSLVFVGMVMGLSKLLKRFQQGASGPTPKRDENSHRVVDNEISEHISKFFTRDVTLRQCFSGDESKEGLRENLGFFISQKLNE